MGKAWAPKSDSDRQAEVDGLIKRMGDGVAAAIKSPETWRAALKRQAHFHSYSFGNQLLIVAQCPQASQVAGYVTWQQHGRQVRKGEQAIAILAPMLVTKDKDTEEERKVLVGFRVARVFDVSQTDAIPGAKVTDPTPPELLADAGEAWTLLEAFSFGRGVPIVREWTGSARGYYAHQPSRKIAVRADLEGPWAVKTEAHEIAHSILHPEGYAAGEDPKPRDLAELEAESTAFVVLSALGLETPELEWYSFGYVAGWHPDAKAVMAAGERIAKAARAMLDYVAAHQGKAVAA
ncbi:MAG: ArdC-like ssDNA-binding domain-containing protein [Steroidobacteraceae bacterium]